FFQAEDGIRDYKVTGVQTCALPISVGPTFPGGERMTQPLTVRCAFHVQREARGRKRVERGPEAAVPQAPAGRVPRVAKLMALALRLEQLLREGAVADQAEVARLGHVTRARVSQILSLVNLAPDLQEAILFLPRTQRGRDPMILSDVMPIAMELDWKRQRRAWRRLMGTV